MEEEQLDNESPENNEGVEEPNSEDGSDDLAKTKEAYENQKVRAEKAEKKLKELEAKSAKVEKPETPKTEEQSNEPDYAKLAFLEGKGVKHPDDQKVVQEEANRLKLPLTDILEMAHIKSKLKDAKDQREAEDGMPEGGSGKSGSGKTSIDYWVNRKDKDGAFLTPSDPELAGKVIDARIKKESKDSMFDSDHLYTG